MTLQPYPTKAQFQAEAARRMATHEYTQLVSNDDVEAWRCKRPGTGCYWFDIIVTSARIVVTGDIEGLLFGVGKSYGISWLTHQDKGYVAEKLEQQCRHLEFDEPCFQQAVAELAAERIDALLPGFDCPLPEERVPAWVRNSSDKSCTFTAVKAWVNEFKASDALPRDQARALEDIDEALGSASEVDDTRDAYQFLYDCEAFNVDSPSDYRLERLDQEMMQRLYMVDLAATAILAIKFPPAPAVASPVEVTA